MSQLHPANRLLPHRQHFQTDVCSILQTYNALIVDSLIIFSKALSSMMRNNTSFKTAEVLCDSGLSIWKYGHGFRNALKEVRQQQLSPCNSALLESDHETFG